MPATISPESIAATLSKHRSDIDLNHFIGMSYSTVVKWNNANYYKNDKKHFRYFLEYFRRVNLEAVAILHKHYSITPANKPNIIMEHLLPEKEFKGYVDSRIAWKRNAISILLSMDKNIFIEQVKMIKMIVAAEENPADIETLIEEEKRDSYCIPEVVRRVDTTHLENL